MVTTRGCTRSDAIVRFGQVRIVDDLVVEQESSKVAFLKPKDRLDWDTTSAPKCRHLQSLLFVLCRGRVELNRRRPVRSEYQR